MALKNLGLALLATLRYSEAEPIFAEGLEIEGQSAELRAQLTFGLADARIGSGKETVNINELQAAAADVAVEAGEGSLLHLAMLATLARYLPAHDAAISYGSILAALQPDEFDAQQLRARVLGYLGILRWTEGDNAGALEALVEAFVSSQNQIAEDLRARSAFEGPETSLDLDPALLTLIARSFADQDDARRVAFRVGVSGKRLQAEMIAAQNELILQGAEEVISARDLAAKLRRTAAWRDKGTGSDDAERELAELEDALSRAVPREALLETLERSTAENIASALPEDVTLVEYVRCRSFSVLANAGRSETYHPAWYAAFVLPAGRPDNMALLDLGDAAQIDDGADTLRRAIASEDLPDPQWRTYARQLAELVWDPLIPVLPESTPYFLAPDGALCATPFEALIGPDDEPLLRTRLLSVLATGRDAYHLGTRANWRSETPLVIAAPDFGDPSTPFEPLPSGHEEGEAIAGLLGVHVVADKDATREFLLNCVDPEVLHLATHGYYLPPSEFHEGLEASLAARAVRHPLLSSGVALADANRPEPPGVVTALDILGMRLAGTDLVVLSACESGLGAPDEEEGLLGLARSFLLSGARSVVWSLWRVDDDHTRRLMELFYRRMLAGWERGVALRDSKLELYAANPERPDSWAGFVLQGDPGYLLRYRFVQPPAAQQQPRVPQRYGNLFFADNEERLISRWEVPSDNDEPQMQIVSTNLRVNTSLRNAWVVDAKAEFDSGQYALENGSLHDARRHFEKALDLVRDEPDSAPLLNALLHGRLSVVMGALGKVKVARREGLIALKIFDAMGVIGVAQAIVLDNLAAFETALGDRRKSLEHLDRSLAVKQVLLPPGDAQIAFTEQIIATCDGGHSQG